MSFANTRLIFFGVAQSLLYLIVSNEEMDDGPPAAPLALPCDKQVMALHRHDVMRLYSTLERTQQQTVRLSLETRRITDVFSDKM